MKNFRRFITLIIALIGIISVMAFTASAANVADAIDANLPIITYASPANNAKRVYAYNNSSLSQRLSNRYIDTYTDQIAVTDITNNGRAVLVTYPTSGGGYRSAWFRTEDIFGINPGSTVSNYTATSSSKTYRLSSSSSVTSYGSIAKNDYCVNLGRHNVNHSAYYSTIYPIGRTSIYNVSGIRHKVAFSTVKEPASNQNTNTTGNSFVSDFQISSAASVYGISTGSNAYKALQSINTKYASKLSSNDKKGTLVFMFEGVGNNSSSGKRMNAMCVVVQNGRITYINRNSSTIPDYPFDPSRNDYTDMPTLKSGIYSFTTVNHNNSYAALNVSGAKVVRFSNRSSYYNSTSYGINVHRRSSNSIAASNASWVNSAGCLLVGASGTSSFSEYAKFIQTLGIVSSGAAGNAKYGTKVSGKIIVDRAYAYNYLNNVGYYSSAINAIG